MERKEQITAAAVDLIRHTGFSNFSVGALANRLNVSKGVITYHYPSVETLLHKIVEEYYADAAHYMEQHMQGVTGAEDALHAYIASNLSFVKDRQAQTVAVVEIVQNFRTADGELVFKSGDDSIYQPLIEIFQYGQEVEKTYRAFTPEIMARSVRGVIDGISLAIAKGAVANVDDAIREVSLMFQLATLKNQEDER